ncbi:uncharacterized protein LOC110848747 [Folsomia candida]|uniref:Putative diacylglycerol O-acyltransferase tgs1 n=1 Tax=Folsomia candida TaxID=158441 RepID=A0A226EE00_FOLCA|nr:uncharacterized protein LOC110848747 [Folsomia candida]OXA55853.1 putative diacylglycerol O-acyltransferase tgs1 [Folsomia candida]
MAPSRSQGHAFGLRDLVVSLFPVLIGLIASVLFWGLIVPLGLLILIPFRTFVLQSALNFRYGKGRFTLADGIDALFGNDETSGSSSAPHMLLVCKGTTPNISVLQNRFLQHVFTYGDDTSGQAIFGERLKSRFVARKWGWPVWERMDEDAFDIRRHVKLLSNSGSMLSEDDVLDRMSELIQEKEVHATAPQWEFLLVPYYTPKNVPAQSQDSYFACIIRLHHAYGDGASVLLLLDKALADCPIAWKIDPMQPLVRSPPLIWTLSAHAFGILPFLRTLFSTMWDNSPFIVEEKRGYSDRKFVAWSEPIRLSFFKELKNNSGTAFSSIVLTAFCSALRKLYHQKMDSSQLPDVAKVALVSAMIPYKTCRLQNTFCTYSVPCAISQPDVSLRLQETHASLKKITSSGEPIFAYFAMRASGLLPRVVMDPIISAARTAILYSNIPGPTRPVVLFGSEVIQMGGWLSMIKSYGFGIISKSTCDHVRLCLTTDSSLISSRSELSRFLEDVEDELEMLGRIYHVPLVRNDKDDITSTIRRRRSDYDMDLKRTG